MVGKIARPHVVQLLKRCVNYNTVDHYHTMASIISLLISEMYNIIIPLHPARKANQTKPQHYICSATCTYYPTSTFSERKTFQNMQ